MSRRRHVLVAGLILALAGVLAANLQPGADTRRSIVTRWQIARGHGHIAGESFDIDRFYDQFPQGNLFVLYEGFETDTWDNRFWVMHNYYRGSYRLYPRRLYVTAGKARLFEAPLILAANSRPPDDWLRAHEVRYVLSVSRQGTRVEVLE